MPNQSHHYAKIGEDPAQKKKLETAQKHYIVQQALGRPIKKYNLLISRDDGDWFSSEDDLDGGLIMGVLVKLEKEHPINCGAWTLMYRLASVKPVLEGRQFFLYANLSDLKYENVTGDINKFEYFHWSEEGEKKEEVKKKKKKATKKELEEENKKLKEQIDRERYEHNKEIMKQQDKHYLEEVSPMEKQIEELTTKLNEAEDVLQNLGYKWSDEFQGYSCEEFCADCDIPHKCEDCSK
jgi:hypothetical protein